MVDASSTIPRWPQALAEIHDVVTAALMPCEVSESVASAKACTMIRALAVHHGGRAFYLPTIYKLDLALRDVRIYAEFNGGNIRNLAENYQLSRQQIYSIVADQRALRKII